MSWPVDLRKLIMDARYTEWPVFVGELPDTPDRCVALIAYAGTAGRGRDDLRAQVLVRAETTAAERVMDHAQELRVHLLDLAEQLSGATDIRWVNPVGTVNDIGRDAKARPRVAFNLEIGISRQIAA